MKYSVRVMRRRGAAWRLLVASHRFGLLFIGLAVLAGCVPARVVQYTSFHERDFSGRSRPAEIQQKTAADLLDSGYLLIGYIDLRRNVRTCYEDGQCVDHSDALPSVDELRQEAAQRGGDVVTLLDERTVLEQRDKSICTQTSVSVIMVNNSPQVTTICVAHRTVPGKLEAKISRALIWRHDPAAAGGEANARAIEAALKTLEAAHQAEAAKAASGGSFLSALGGSFAKRDAGAAREADALSRQVYNAIADNDARALYALARDGKLQAWTDPDGRSALMVALSVDRTAAARTLLAIDKGLERRDNNGLSAMHYAVARADLPFVRELVKIGYDVRLKTNAGASLLCYALLSSRTDVFDWLLTQGLDPRERTAQDETTLMVAAEVGPDAALRRLLRLGVGANEQDREGRTALMAAARAGRLEATRLLLNARARHDAADHEGNTVLHYAARGGNDAIIDLLLKGGLGVNTENKRGGTPLTIAFATDQWDAARHLMKRGASLTTSKITAEETALFLISKNQPPLLRRYLAAFPPLRELLARDPDWLQYAAKKSGRETIRFLVDLGARIDRPGTDGLTPLMAASGAGNHEAVRALLELKANPTLRNRGSQTALKIATLGGHAKVVEALREFGVRE